MNSERGDQEATRALALVTGIGVLFAVSIVVGVGLGLLGSRLLGGNALPLVAGIVVGFVTGGFGVYRMVMRVYR
ncbi:MAG: AtpZ/AtpI family protein [Candidatus Dormibacteria bacterium]